MNARYRRNRELARTLAAPALLALVSGGGLVVALLGEATVDLVACAAIAAPIAAVGWAWVRRRR